jgi:two-component system, LuxR family, response regulator FixJ
MLPPAIDLDQCRSERAMAGKMCTRRSFGPGPKGSSMTEAKQGNVAIVDDDTAVRDSLRFLLEVVVHPVETFASAAEFLKAEIRHLACLILDHHMPEMTGLELVERLRADGSSIPILLITGSPSPTIVARAAELGINRVIEKPLTEDDLLGFINTTRSWASQLQPGLASSQGHTAQAMCTSMAWRPIDFNGLDESVI